MIGTILATISYLLITLITDADGFTVRLEETPVLGDVPQGVLVAVLVLLSFVNVPLFVLDSQLVVLHLILMSQGVTTYEYIVNKQSGLQGRGQPDASPGSSDRLNGSDDERKDEASNPRRFQGRAVTALPRCLDWIIFCKCGRRRRRNMPIPKADASDSPPARSSDVDLEAIPGMVSSPEEEAPANIIEAPANIIGSPMLDFAPDGESASQCPPTLTPAPLFKSIPVPPDMPPRLLPPPPGPPEGISVRCSDGLRQHESDPWQANCNYRTIEELELLEGPNLWATQTGTITEGSLLTVLEVDTTTTKLCGRQSFAKIKVQDGLSCGQEGWVRGGFGPPCLDPPAVPRIDLIGASAEEVRSESWTSPTQLPSDCRMDEDTIVEDNDSTKEVLCPMSCVCGGPRLLPVPLNEVDVVKLGQNGDWGDDSRASTAT